MNTFLSPLQQAAKDKYYAYAQAHLGEASAMECAATAQAEALLPEFLRRLGAEGFLGLHIPKEYGGQGASFVDVILLSEALASRLPALGLILSEHYAVIETIKRSGSDSQKSRYLPALARGESLGCTAFSEPSAGTDFKAVSTKLEGGTVSGKKTWVANANLSEICLASVLNEQNLPSLALLDLAKDSTTITLSERHRLLGMHAVGVYDIDFSQHKLAEGGVFTSSAHDFDEQILFAFDVGKTVLAAAALGSIESAMKIAVEHANQREQFGQKIGQFQGIQWKLADMSTETSACRLLTYRAAWDKDEAPQSFRKDAAMCKWFAGRLAQKQSGEAVQILGARGLVADSPLERFYRDGKMMEICQGTAEFQKIILAQELGV